MSFARNFAAGQQIAQNAMDTFNTARRNRDLRRIADARPQELSGFSEADADQMRAMSQAINPETGQPYYQFEDNGQGGLNVRNNFAFQGQDGQMVEPGSTQGLRQRPLTEFLGRRYDTPLTEQQMDAARYRAKADVLGRDDPILGMRMRRELRQDDRDDWRFGVEQQRAPLQTQQLEQQVRAGGLQVRNLEREDAWETGFGEALASYTGDEEQLSTVIPFVNSSRAITMEDPDPKTGLVRLSVVREDGRAVAMNLNRQDQAQVFAAVQMMQSNPTRALDVLRRVNGDLADAVARENQMAGTLAGNANNVASTAHGMGMARERLDLQVRETGARIGAINRPQWQHLVGADGEPVMVDLNSVQSRGGVAQLPEGVRMPRLPQTLSDQQMVAYRAALEAINQLPPNAPQGQVDAIYARFGLDPRQFGGSGGMPGWGGNQPAPTDGRASAAPSSGISRPIPAPNITRARPQFGNPANFERRSERGLFGGVNYFYYDPATRRRLSVEEYSRLTGGQ